MDDIRRKIGTFFSDTLHYDLHEHEDIFALGFVRSIVILQLVLFIEREFDIRIEHLHREIESFRTVATIAQLVERNIASARRVSFIPSRLRSEATKSVVEVML